MEEKQNVAAEAVGMILLGLRAKCGMNVECTPSIHQLKFKRRAIKWYKCKYILNVILRN